MQITQYIVAGRAINEDLYSDPAQFTAAYLELQKITNGADMTHLPILYDATCNGMQHLGLLSRSEIGSQLSNAIGSDLDVRNDVYNFMAHAAQGKIEKIVKEHVEKYNAGIPDDPDFYRNLQPFPDVTGLDTDEAAEKTAHHNKIIKDAPLSPQECNELLSIKFTRSMLKGPVMTVCYSTGMSKMAVNLRRDNYFTPVYSEITNNVNATEDDYMTVEEFEAPKDVEFGYELLVNEHRTVIAGTQLITAQGQTKKSISK